MPVLPKSAFSINIPNMVKVKQKFDDKKLENIDKEIHNQLSQPEIMQKVQPNQRIALAVGSRGIKNLDKIVKSIIKNLKEMGAKPFIITAMGSHGGGIAKEQLKILNNYGITEEIMDVPIVSNIESIKIGSTKSGIPVLFDKEALKADMIVPINRIKPHTDFKGKIESGLCKMLVIGLGNHEGCSTFHKEGFENFHTVIPDAAEVILENAPIGFGVAILENSYDETLMVKAIPSESFMSKEEELLKVAKKLMPQILIPEIDVLIVEQLGKDITGAGMDPNIVGRTARGIIVDFKGPKIKRIIVLGLTKKTNGNATGIGMADFTTKQVYDEIDFVATYANSIASGNPEAGKIPIIMENEKEAIIAAIRNCSRIDENNAKIVRIKNTLELGEILVSDNLLHFIKQNKSLSLS